MSPSLPDKFPKLKSSSRGRSSELHRRHVQVRFKLAKKYGPEFDKEYSKLLGQVPDHARSRIWRIKKLVLEAQLGFVPNQNTLRRIESLNYIAGLPLLNVGWNCMRCNRYHKDPRFFDIDHIVQRSDKGQDEISNLQNLCPNCHRIKTLGMEKVHLQQSFRPTASTLSAGMQLMPQIVAQGSLL